VIFLFAGLAANARRTGTPTIRARVLSGLSGLAGALGVLLALAGGGRLYVSQIVTIRGLDLPGFLLLLGGAVLLAVAVLSARWSSAGALVAGAIVTITGLVTLASPLALSFAVGWRDLGRGLEIAGPSGTLLLIGLLLVVAGLAVRVRARRAAEIQEPVASPSV
jgi:hypothetical protein